jgi:hypothetical protein
MLWVYHRVAYAIYWLQRIFRYYKQKLIFDGFRIIWNSTKSNEANKDDLNDDTPKEFIANNISRLLKLHVIDLHPSCFPVNAD